MSNLNKQSKNVFWDTILLVIVLYREELYNTKTFESIEKASSILNEKLDLFVYDNSPVNQSVTSYVHDRFNIVYTSDINNSGLSKAYNSGFDHAIKHGKKFVILLDQDTEFTIDFFTKYEQAALNNKEIDIFAPKLVLNNGKIFSPCTYKFKRGWYPSETKFGINKLKDLVPVNSGVMISTKLFQKVGGYNEKLRVDFIDFQFMEKAIKITDKFYFIDEVGEQEFSDESTDVDGQLFRFEIYLSDIKHIKKESIGDKVQFAINILMHTLKLTWKFKTLDFVKVIFKDSNE